MSQHLPSSALMLQAGTRTVAGSPRAGESTVPVGARALMARRAIGSGRLGPTPCVVETSNSLALTARESTPVFPLLPAVSTPVSPAPFPAPGVRAGELQAEPIGCAQANARQPLPPRDSHAARESRSLVRAATPGPSKEAPDHG